MTRGFTFSRSADRRPGLRTRRARWWVWSCFSSPMSFDLAPTERRAGLGPMSFWPKARIRRPLDVARLTFALGAVVVLLVLAIFDAGLLQAVAGWIPIASSGMGRTVLSIANVIASMATIGVLVAIAVDAVRVRRFSLISASLAGVLGVLGGVGVVELLGVAAPAQVIPLLLGPPEESAGLPITAVIALVVGADLHHRRWWNAARLALVAGVCCALGQGSLTLAGAGYALATGVAAGLAVRVALGVVPARPAEELIRSVLAGAGFELTALDPLENAAGRIRYTGIRPDAAEVRVTVVDSDRGGVPLARRAWRLLLLRNAAVGRPALSLRGQLERQALTAALAKSAGVPGPEVLAVLAAGPALVLVERLLVGTPLAHAGDEDAVRGTVSAFRALRRLHQAGLAHGALTADDVLLMQPDLAGFADFVSAQPAATDLQRELDVVALLVAAGSRVPVDAVVSALNATYSPSPTAQMRLAALLQPLSLPRQARRAVRGTPLLANLRAALTGPDGEGVVADAPRLERLRLRTVISVVGGTIAVYLLATQLSQVSIGSALRSAQPGWLVVALAGSAVTYLGSALALQAFVPAGLPLTRTAFVQLASSFVSLVTPPAVGHMGLNIRYLHRAGVPTAAAATDVAVKEAMTVAVTVPLLLICGWLSGVSGSRLALLPSGSVLIVIGVAAAVLALVALAPPTRRFLRRRLDPLIRRTLPQLLATLSDPRRLVTAVGGVLLLNGGYVLALEASLRAFGTSVALPALVVVYLAASTLGSATPIPGGLGAVEAALVGGLTATGVPVAAAVTAVLAFRAATFWLPAPLGWGAFVALQRRGRI